jgi:CBS domain-containing protein
MQCQKIMSRRAQWIAPEQTIAHATELMEFHNLGFLPICSADGRPLGVITDRDIALRVAGKNKIAAETRVEEVMTTSLHSVGLDCSVADAGALMAEAGVSRLLVLNDGGILEGVISVADLIMHGPGHSALRTARGIYAREVVSRPGGHPHLATDPTPEFFHGERDLTSPEGFAATNPARLEAETEASGRANQLKEWPS